MRREFLAALAVTLAASVLPGQQDATPSSPSPADTVPAAPHVYFVGPDVTSPELIPSNPLPVFTGKCKKQDDSVDFALVVGTAGHPRRITYSRALVSDLDKMALQIVTADRFTPGKHNGEAAAVAISLKVILHGCFESIKDASGQKSYLFHLRSQPAQKIAPIPQPPEGSVPALTLQESTESTAPPDLGGREQTARAPCCHDRLIAHIEHDGLIFSIEIDAADNRFLSISIPRKSGTYTSSSLPPVRLKVLLWENDAEIEGPAELIPGWVRMGGWDDIKYRFALQKHTVVDDIHSVAISIGDQTYTAMPF